MTNRRELMQVEAHNLREHNPDGVLDYEGLIDLGLTPIEDMPKLLADVPTESTPVTDVPKPHLYEMPGRNRGRVNSYDQPVTPQQAQEGMSPEEVEEQQAYIKRKLAPARTILESLRDKSS